MAKKKAAGKKTKKKAAASRARKVRPVKKAAKKKAPNPKKTAAKGGKKKKKAAARKTAKTAKKKTARKSAKKAKRLGRARVSADAKLDLVFQTDYQAREVFDFLRVKTLRELEDHSPDEIVERMTHPLVQTVDRIRKALAMANRCLARDEKFALEFLATLRSRR